MDITKVHYDPAAAITVKAKKKIPADDIVGRTPIVDIAAVDAYPFGVVAHDVEKRTAMSRFTAPGMFSMP